MLTQETKRHIDAARQVLVGVVPNPSSQIEQITNALIYKFMDDMDQSAIKAGGDPSFFVGSLERYAWTRLMNSRLGNQERMNLYSEALVKFSEAKQLPSLFRDIFKSAFLPYRSPEVLGLFLKEIDYFDYSHSEELGNAYEYLLSIMGSQGDAGQFRTPRHIIDFIVAAVNPTKDDKVLDPACGTSGFLVSAYKHILEQHDGKNPDGSKNDEKPLTPDQRRKLMDNFEGYDVDPGMVRISQVNLYLHHFKNPRIFSYNTLTDDERWKDNFDVILANPPFMSPKGGVPRHNKFGIPSNRSEVLFVDYFITHLRPKGRAGMIVPEGIIFQSATAHTALRKKLVEDGLYAVVSLPSGVFQPYSGVKTSILFFDNERAKQNAEILFIKVENDGFGLGAQRRKIDRDNLPQALEILRKWKHGKKVESKLAVYVKRGTILESDDYNLSGDRYRVVIDYSNAKWPMMELGEVIKINFGGRITKNNQKGTKYPVYGGGGESFRTDNFNRENEYVISRFAMSENCVRYVKGQFWLMDSGGTFSINKEYESKLNKCFIGNILLSRQSDIFMCARGGAQKNLNVNHLYELKIPLPPFEIQKQIVAELDDYQNIIAGARQVSENWKPKIDIDPEWKKIIIGNVAKVQGGFAFKSQDMTAKDGAQIIKIGNVKDQRFDYKNNPSFVGMDLYNGYPDYQLSVGDILISMTGTAGKRDYGNVCMVDVEGKFLLNQRVGRIVPNSNILNNYLFFALNQNEAKDKFYLNATGGIRQGNISNKQIELIEIPFPPLIIQKQIVEKIETERALVESAKKLIEIYEQKTKDVIAKLWSE
jgi:type I restriction enzyme M protein